MQCLVEAGMHVCVCVCVCVCLFVCRGGGGFVKCSGASCGGGQFGETEK